MKSSPLKHLGKHPAADGHQPHEHEAYRTFEELGNNPVTNENQNEIIGRKAAELEIIRQEADSITQVYERDASIFNNSTNAINNAIERWKINPAKTREQLVNRANAYDKAVEINAEQYKKAEYERNMANLAIHNYKEAQNNYIKTVDSIYEVNYPLLHLANEQSKVPVGDYQGHDEVELQQKAYIAMSPDERQKYYDDLIKTMK